MALPSTQATLPVFTARSSFLCAAALSCCLTAGSCHNLRLSCLAACAGLQLLASCAACAMKLTGRMPRQLPAAGRSFLHCAHKDAPPGLSGQRGQLLARLLQVQAAGADDDEVGVCSHQGLMAHGKGGGRPLAWASACTASSARRSHEIPGPVQRWVASAGWHSFTDQLPDGWVLLPALVDVEEARHGKSIVLRWLSAADGVCQACCSGRPRQGGQEEPELAAWSSLPAGIAIVARTSHGKQLWGPVPARKQRIQPLQHGCLQKLGLRRARRAGKSICCQQIVVPCLYGVSIGAGLGSCCGLVNASL